MSTSYCDDYHAELCGVEKHVTVDDKRDEQDTKVVETKVVTPPTSAATTDVVTK